MIQVIWLSFSEGRRTSGIIINTGGIYLAFRATQLALISSVGGPPVGSRQPKMYRPLTREMGLTKIHVLTHQVGLEREDISTLKERLTPLETSVVWHSRAWDIRLMPLARR